MEVRLTVVDGPDKGKVFKIEESTTCLAGRSSDAKFRFSKKDPYISRRHFILEISPPKVYFKDLDVVNPSRINKTYVDETELNEGDEIEVGFTRLKVSINREIKQTKKVACLKCDKVIEIYFDEDPDVLCPECEKSMSSSAVIETAGQDDVGHAFYCCECERDLKVLAMSDELHDQHCDKVTYCCRECLPEKDDHSNRQIADYEFIRMIGEGGMGRVFLVYHGLTARLLVLKEVNIINPLLGARFEREIRIMKRLENEFVLSYIDSGQDSIGGKPYLVMEYATNGSLSTLLGKRNGEPDTKRIIQLIVQSLTGLEYIHQQGIIHRDIKPDNILLSGRDHEEPIPKIADFGLAREFRNAGGSVLTRLGIALGTVLYMPPEQIRDAHSVRETADLYSVGATLYHLLSGKYPFNFPTEAEIRNFIEDRATDNLSPHEALRLMIDGMRYNSPYQLVLGESPIPIEKRVSDISPELARIVNKSILKDPNKRYQTAEDFRNDLERVLPTF